MEGGAFHVHIAVCVACVLGGGNCTCCARLPINYKGRVSVDPATMEHD